MSSEEQKQEQQKEHPRGPKLSKEEKKAKKAAEKAAKEAKKAAQRAEREALQNAKNAPREVVLIDSPESAAFGDLKLFQSQYDLKRNFVDCADLTAEAFSGKSVWLRGRIHRSRKKGQTCFVTLRRGSATVQLAIFAGDDTPKEFVDFVSKVPFESIVDVYGSVVKVENPTRTSQSDVEILIQRFYVVSASGALPFTMDDACRPDPDVEAGKGATVGQDTRLNNRPVDLRTPTNHSIFRVQSQVCRAFRDFLLDRDFIEIHSPKITPGVSEGGADVFRLDYFGRPACLAQSPQLYKQMSAACGDLFAVFEVAPVFRAENSHTHRHACEFMGLDLEVEIKDHYHEVLRLLGGLFVHIFDFLNERNRREIETVRAQHPFEDLRYLRETLRLEFKDGIAMLREAGVEIGDFDDLTTPQEKKLGELVAKKYGTDFYILDKYPVNARPFYTMPDPVDPRYTNSYDLFIRGEEITSGAQRIHDVELLKKRAVECGIPLDNIKAYTDSFSYGVPPHGGAGIGLERVVMLFLGLNNIRKSALYPRDPNRVEP